MRRRAGRTGQRESAVEWRCGKLSMVSEKQDDRHEN